MYKLWLTICENLGHLSSYNTPSCPIILDFLAFYTCLKLIGILTYQCIFLFFQYISISISFCYIVKTLYLAKLKHLVIWNEEKRVFSMTKRMQGPPALPALTQTKKKHYETAHTGPPACALCGFFFRTEASNQRSERSSTVLCNYHYYWLVSQNDCRPFFH